MRVKCNKDVIRVTIDRIDLVSAFRTEEAYKNFLTELMISIKKANDNYSFKEIALNKHLTRV